MTFAPVVIARRVKKLNLFGSDATTVRQLLRYIIASHSHPYRFTPSGSQQLRQIRTLSRGFRCSRFTRSHPASSPTFGLSLPRPTFRRATPVIIFFRAYTPTHPPVSRDTADSVSRSAATTAPATTTTVKRESTKHTNGLHDFIRDRLRWFQCRSILQLHACP
jgi:hypothetical protein